MTFGVGVRVPAAVLAAVLGACGGGSSGNGADGGSGGGAGAGGHDPGNPGGTGGGEGGTGGTIGAGGTGGVDLEETCRGTVYLPGLPLLPTDAPVGAVALADFENDGDLDLLVGLRGDPPSIAWLENRDGRLDAVAAQLVAGTPTPARLLAADLDGAGPLDLVASGTGRGEGVTLVLHGDAGFTTAALPWTGAIVQDVAIGDFDGDGDVELAAFGGDEGGGEVRFARNDGGALAWIDPTVASGAWGPHRLAAGDLDGDGADDLLVLDAAGATVSRVVFAAGLPTVALPAYRPDFAPGALALGDLDGDGDLDLAFDHGRIALGDGTGGFTAAPPPEEELGATEVLLADVDADGDLDYVGTDADGRIEVLSNDRGAFHATTAAQAGAGAPAPVAGDFTGDGLVDLVIGRVDAFEVELHENPGNGAFVGRVAVGGETAAPAPRATVFDLEGAPLVAVSAGARVNLLDGQASAFGASSDAALAVARTVTVDGAELVDLAAGDLDGDGRVDLVALDRRGSRFLVFPGTGGLDFGPPTAYAAGADVRWLALGDVSGDGALDVLVAEGVGMPSLRVFRGPGFEQPTSTPLAAAANGLAVRDFDGDGHADPVVWTDRYLEVLHGKPNGTLGSLQIIDLPARAVAVADADLDGTADLVVSPLEGDAVQVYAGIAGTGTFEQRLVLPVGGRPGPIAIGDIDGDRAADAFVLLPEQGAIRVLRGAVGYVLSAGDMYPAGPRDGSLFGASLVAPDLAGDGGADLVLVGPGGAWTFATECRE